MTCSTDRLPLLWHDRLQGSSIYLRHCKHIKQWAHVAPPQDCCFHPTEPLVAVGLVSGRVQVFANSASPSAQGDAEVAEHEERLRKKPHKESCRALRFMPDGATLLTASADKCEQDPCTCMH